MEKTKEALKRIGVLSLVVILLYTVVLPLSRDSGIYSSVIRLHVPANSNSSEDISLKMALKDSVCLYVEGMVEDCESVEEAARVLERNKADIKCFADVFLKKNGAEYLSEVSFGKEYYPTRHYDKISLPAGEYLSLRISLGKGEGENWWCVMFPPACLSASTPDGEIFEDGVFSSGNERNLRFFILDFFSSLFR